jgi:hypothetical protein
MKFKSWLEAITAKDLKRARKGMQKKRKQSAASGRSFKNFKPRTFGIELEFRVESEDGRSINYSDDELNDIRKELKFKLQDELTERMNHRWGSTPSWNGVNSLLNKFDEFSEDKFPPYNEIEDWEEENPEPEEDEKEERLNWKKERREIEKQIDDFDYEKLKDEFIDEIIEDEEWGRFDVYPDVYLPDFESKAEEYQEFLEDLGWKANIEENLGTSAWYIHKDGDTVFELTSPILTTKDIPALKQLFDKVSNERTDGSTSCHIHIGLPPDTDGFDLLAMSTLVDEKEIKRQLPNRAFDEWAKFNSDMQRQLGRYLEDGTYSKEDFLSTIKQLGLRSGTNINSFWEHRTIEFRYLSSEALKNPNSVLEWINYFLILPFLARGRKQIVIAKGPTVTGLPGIHPKSRQAIGIYLTRMPDGGVKVDKDPEGKVKQSPESPEDLRQQSEMSPLQRSLNKQKKQTARKRVNNQTMSQFLGSIKKNDRDAIVGSLKSSLTDGGWNPARNPFLKKYPFLLDILKEDPWLNNNSNFIKAAEQIQMKDVIDASSTLAVRRSAGLRAGASKATLSSSASFIDTVYNMAEKGL